MSKILSRVAPALVLAACATARAEPADLDPLSRGLVALSAERWPAAEAALAEAAGRCESGRSGLEAVLLLATTALQPDNPARSPDLAARYAAHAIRLPDVDAVRLELARALYLTAVDLGAGLDTTRSSSPPPPLAPRFSACDEEDFVAGPLRPLPGFVGTPLAARADSLQAVVRAVESVTREMSEGPADAAATVGDDVARMRSRIDALEAELGRIRRLLRQGGG